MATQQNFDDLVTRITNATNTLEVATTEVVNSSLDVAEAVQVTNQNRLAVEAAQTAVEDIQQEVGVTASTIESKLSEANTAALEAQQAVTDAKQLAPFDEAPKNGSVYGRKDGEWSLVESSGGGQGTVVSVNNITPDEQGNVTLPIPEPTPQQQVDWNAVSGVTAIKNKPTLFSGSYTDLTNKPIIPSRTNQLTNDSGFIADAPADGVKYVRQNNLWVIAPEGGGGGGGSTDTKFLIEEDFYYGEDYITKWMHNNPHQPININDVYGYVFGDWEQGAANLESQNIRNFPCGNYYFSYSSFNHQTSSHPLYQQRGWIEIRQGINFNGDLQKFALAYVVDTDNKIGSCYSNKPTTSTWTKMWGV